MRSIELKSVFSNVLIKLFYFCLAIVPFGLALFNTAAYVIGYPYAQNYLTVLVIFFLSLVLGSYVFISRFPANISRKTDVLAIIMLFLLSFLLRIAAVLIIKGQPVSDFFMAYDNAVDLSQGIVNEIYQSRYSIYPEWGVYSITLAALFRLVTPTVLCAQIFNCILGSLTTVTIYKVVSKLFCSYKIGILSAAIFLFNPTIIIYAGVLTAEHIVILLTVCFLHVFALLHEYRTTHQFSRKTCRYYILYAVVLGILIGLIGAYRYVGLLYIVAYIVIELILYIPNYIKNRTPNNLFSKHVLASIVITVIIFLVNSLVYNMAIYALNTSMKIENSNPINSGYGYTLYLGIGLDEEGNYSTKPAKEFSASYTGPKEDFSNACFEKAIDCVKQYYYKYPGILWEKFSTVWGRYSKYPESAYIEWSFYPQAILNQTEAETHPLIENYYGEIATFLGQYYLILLGLALVGVLRQLKEKINANLFFSGLVIFGFTLITLLGQAQGRYRSILFAIISIFAAIGIRTIVSIIGTGCKKIRAIKDGLEKTVDKVHL